MRGLALLALSFAAGCASDPLDDVALGYVALVRAHGSNEPSLPTARSLLDAVRRVQPSPRAAHLARQLRALDARFDGRARTFDEESRLLYGVVAPRPDLEEARAVRGELDALLPGEANLRSRLLSYQKRFAVPGDKVDALLERAIDECRRRTREHLALPEDEAVTLEYVRGMPWPSFSSYRGSYRSSVQINRDYPLPVGKVLEIAAHEAYPGHHVASVLLERDLVRSRGLIEYGVEPEVGPDALVREGLASNALDLVFPRDERLAFERSILFPLAGLDPEEAERYAKVERLTRRLESLGVDIARRYLDGERDRVQSVLELEDHALLPDPWGFLRFVDRYRTYVVTYTVGAVRVRERLESDSDTWGTYAALLAASYDET